jgi:hypothetical protein
MGMAADYCKWPGKPLTSTKVPMASMSLMTNMEFVKELQARTKARPAELPQERVRFPILSKRFIPQKLQPWIEARRRFHLSHAHVQMARELGMNPKKLGKLDNHKQERWKLPLPLFIEECYRSYRKRFGKLQPDDPRPLEAKIAEKATKKAARKAAKAAAT